VRARSRAIVVIAARATSGVRTDASAPMGHAGQVMSGQTSEPASRIIRVLQVRHRRRDRLVGLTVMPPCVCGPAVVEPREQFSSVDAVLTADPLSG
jgi:hypothetical protein